MEFHLTDNADHPLEHEVVRVARSYLEKMQWPFARLPIRITFGVRTLPSQSAVNAEVIDGRLQGKATIFFNYVYLLQQEGLFIKDVVPHEIAHLLANAGAIRDGKRIKDHGNEWQRWLVSLTVEAIPKASGPGNIFDDRAIRLFSGGIPVKCACPSGTGFNVLPVTAENKLHEMICDKCETAYVKTGRDDMPSDVAMTYEYIANEQSRRRSA